MVKWQRCVWCVVHMSEGQSVVMGHSPLSATMQCLALSMCWLTWGRHCPASLQSLWACSVAMNAGEAACRVATFSVASAFVHLTMLLRVHRSWLSYSSVNWPPAWTRLPFWSISSIICCINPGELLPVARRIYGLAEFRTTAYRNSPGLCNSPSPSMSGELPCAIFRIWGRQETHRKLSNIASRSRKAPHTSGCIENPSQNDFKQNQHLFWETHTSESTTLL